jgi:hypothetical protein
MNSIRNLIADDSFAIGFQSMGQYRTALLKALDATPPAPKHEGDSPAEALAARRLLQEVARLADPAGITVGYLRVLAGYAAAWLRENPPGQSVAIGPRGCPTPGVCSCVEPAPPTAPAGGLVERMADVIGDDPLSPWEEDARAAIREVAAWLDQQGQHGCSLLLREEAGR